MEPCNVLLYFIHRRDSMLLQLLEHGCWDMYAGIWMHTAHRTQGYAKHLNLARNSQNLQRQTLKNHEGWMSVYLDFLQNRKK